MCGINGIFAYHSAASAPKEAELLATREAMRRRGPDGAGAWWNGDRSCGLGHRRLTILDLSDRAAQPMVGADGRLVVTFNGEIYNYPELRAEFEAAGVQLRTTSDTEILLHLYASDGAAMVHRLRGMYAFAIWDEARHELFLARDPYGIKPLYTANDGWTFRFASQVKALLAGGAVSRDPEPAGIVGFHLFGSVPEPFTLYRDIRALPAGHTQLVDAAGPREPQQFANLAAILAAGAAHPAPPAELPERLRTAALDSVRAHLLADVEVGLFLSAGIDSGALLGLMRDAGQRDIRAITLAFDEFRGTADDEAPLAAQVAEHYGAEHIVRRVGKREFDDDLPAILDAMDQPSIDGVNTWFVAKAAKEAGLKVALSGLGGDELLAGYSSFADLPRWRRHFGPFAAIPGLGRLARHLIPALAPGFAAAQPKALGLLEYAHRWAGVYLLRRGLFLPRELPGIMDPDMAREGLRRLRPLRHFAASLTPDPGSDTGRVCALESAHYMRNQLLRDADWAGMAHGIEIRVPLVDVAMLKSMSGIIPALIPAKGKAALAGTPRMPLPTRMIGRAKTGFIVPTRAWLESAGEIGGEFDQSIERRGLVSRRWSIKVLRSFPSRSTTTLPREDTGSILIFRIGSLGDTVVALPCFHLVAQSFPHARRILVTNIPTAQKAVTVESVLGESGLIDDVIYFPEPPRRLSEFVTLRARLRRTQAKTLIYIADRKLWSTLRDIVYFRLCGVRQVIGGPLSAGLRRLRTDPATGHCEREAERLLRSLAPLGSVDLADPRMWDLHLLAEEERTADSALSPLGEHDFIAISIGAKSETKDWGDANWAALLRSLRANWGNLGLVFFGAADEADRCAGLAAGWPGMTLNLCGQLRPRESAAALRRALVFLGHDSGPMHLSSAVGTPCVAVFGNHNLPRRWHPIGPNHRIIHNMQGVAAIAAAEVQDAASEALSEAFGRGKAETVCLDMKATAAA